MLCILDKGAGKKMPPSIIRATCKFDSKIRGFLKVSDFISACMERNKNFFRKIEISQNLPSKFAEKWAKNHAKYKVIRQK